MNYNNFWRGVSNIPWDLTVRPCGTLGINVEKFVETLALLIIRNASLPQRRVSQKYCLWLTSDFYKLGTSRLYRYVRNKVNSLRKKLKKGYYSNNFLLLFVKFSFQLECFGA